MDFCAANPWGFIQTISAGILRRSYKPGQTIVIQKAIDTGRQSHYASHNANVHCRILQTHIHTHRCTHIWHEHALHDMSIGRAVLHTRSRQVQEPLFFSLDQVLHMCTGSLFLVTTGKASALVHDKVAEDGWAVTSQRCLLCSQFRPCKELNPGGVFGAFATDNMFSLYNRNYYDLPR